MSKFLNRGGQNSAPNGVNYTEARIWYNHDWRRVADYSGVIRAALYDPRVEARNLQPVINQQTFWAGNIIATPDGIVPRSVVKRDKLKRQGK